MAPLNLLLYLVFVFKHAAKADQSVQHVCLSLFIFYKLHEFSCRSRLVLFEIKLVSKTHFSLILPSLNLHYFIFNIVGSKNYSWLTRTFPIFPKLQDKFSFYQKTEDWRKNSMWNLWFPICISPCRARQLDISASL